jgi:LSD1 subclass zinc finger protein
MPEQFSCPNCGAQLEYTADQATIKCAFCNSVVQVPQEIVQAARQQAEQVVDAQAASKWTKWIIIFVIVVFVVPSCLGFGGTIFGVVASILASFIGAVVSFTGK